MSTFERLTAAGAAVAVSVLLLACGSSADVAVEEPIAVTDGPTTVYGATVDFDAVVETDAVLWFWAPW